MTDHSLTLIDPGPGQTETRERWLVRNSLIAVGVSWYVVSMGRSVPGFGSHGKPLAVTLCVAAGVMSFVVALFLARRGKPFGAAVFAVSGLLGVVLFALSPNSPATALDFMAVGFAAGRYPIRRSLPTAVLTSAGTAAVVLLVDRRTGELFTIVGLLGLYAGVRAGRTREEARQTEQRNLILAERAHIAREIHDILAHSMSAQLVHLEGARLLIKGGRTDEALERVERARGLARTGLEETRRALATLRGDIPPMDEALRELADEHRMAADARCEVIITGEPHELSAEAGLAVIRTAQEALTNVRKHAPGADSTVELRYAGGWCELEINDTGGEASALAETGSGYGLVGMRERAELIGGSLDTGPYEKGFRVLLRVPLNGVRR